MNFEEMKKKREEFIAKRDKYLERKENEKKKKFFKRYENKIVKKFEKAYMFGYIGERLTPWWHWGFNEKQIDWIISFLTEKYPKLSFKYNRIYDTISWEDKYVL